MEVAIIGLLNYLTLVLKVSDISFKPGVNTRMRLVDRQDGS